jgi:hypothetical protein
MTSFQSPSTHTTGTVAATNTITRTAQSDYTVSLSEPGPAGC